MSRQHIGDRSGVGCVWAAVRDFYDAVNHARGVKEFGLVGWCVCTGEGGGVNDVEPSHCCGCVGSVRADSKHVGRGGVGSNRGGHTDGVDHNVGHTCVLERNGADTNVIDGFVWDVGRTGGAEQPEYIGCPACTGDGGDVDGRSGGGCCGYRSGGGCCGYRSGGGCCGYRSGGGC